MMSKIDWSKAPDWATCVVKRPGLKGDHHWSEDPKNDGQLLHIQTGSGYTMGSPNCWQIVEKRPTTGRLLMTPKAGEHTYEQFIAQGWDDETLIHEGYAVIKPTPDVTVTNVNDDRLTESLRRPAIPQMEAQPNCRCIFTPIQQPSTAPDLLNQAAQLLTERGKQYDTSGQERSSAKIVAAFNTITGRDLTPGEGWLFLMLLKAVRFYSNIETPHRDSLEDLIAYAALHAEEYLNNER